jgi:hypothetical protein
MSLSSKDALVVCLVGVIGNLIHSSPNIKKEVLNAGALQPVIRLLRYNCHMQLMMNPCNLLYVFVCWLLLKYCQKLKFYMLLVLVMHENTHLLRCSVKTPSHICF